MSLQVEKLDGNMAKLTIEVAAEELDKAMEVAYQKNKNKINIQGFRKGKAPRKMIEQMYGKGVFLEDAANDLISESYEKALDECTEDIVSSPRIDVIQLESGKPFIYTAEVALKPEVTLGKYKGVKIDKVDIDVTEEEIAADIAKERDNAARIIPVTDRAVKDGDMTVIDFEGFVDGVAFEGGKGEDYPLKLGSGNFIPGFEEEIVGHKVGEDFDVNVTFPTEYHAKELAGKPAVFKTTILKIKHIELPELDDDFAKDVSEFDTMDEYRADVKAKIAKRHETEADNRFESAILDTLIEKLEADIPEAMFVAETENFVRDYDNRLRMQGLDLKTYFQYTGMTLEQLRESLRPQAEKQVKLRLALEKIAKTEKLKATKTEINAEYKRIADEYQMEVEKVRELIPEESIAEDMKVKKAVDLVKEKAIVK